MLRHLTPVCLFLIPAAAVGQPLPPPAGVQLPAADVPRWRVENTTDRITGKSAVVVDHVQRVGVLIPHRRNIEREVPVGLVLRCEGGRTTVYFYVSGHLVAGYRQTVSYRIDQRPPVTSRAWSASTDSSAIGFWNSPTAVTFAKAISSASKIAFRVDHDVFGRTEFDFDLTGLGDAIRPLRQACRW